MRRNHPIGGACGGLILFLSVSIAVPCMAAEPARRESSSQAAAQQNAPKRFHLLLVVRDENGNPLPQARVTLYLNGVTLPIRGDTDAAGRIGFADLVTSPARALIEKVGFYALTVSEAQLEQAQIEVVLNHTQEFKESVQVKASSEGVDPSQVSQNQRLNATEILELPYTTTRDIRNSFSLLPGVLPDQGGQVHVNGSASNQTLYLLDGFDVSDPVTGLYELRISTDAARAIDVEGSRVSAEYGRGSAGVLAIDSSMGDDHLRFYATDFVPSVQQYKGLRFQNTTPRFAVSGPIKKGKAWFYEAVDGEYDEDIFSNLPANANIDYFWRFSNLLRVQVNLAPGNSITGSFVENRLRDDHAGLSIIQPLSTTAANLDSAHVANIKDEISRANGTLFQVGLGFVEFNGNSRPLGDLPYVEIPGSALGNFYLTSHSQSRRYQIPANLYLPAQQWHGHHQILIGVDLEHTSYQESDSREPFRIQTCASPFVAPGCNATNSTLLERSVSFQGPASFSETDSDLAAFVQDRWSPTPRLLFEPGLRIEGDTLLGKTNVSPRVASTFALTPDGQTKLSAGVGLFYDRVDLSLLALALAGERQDIFYSPGGISPISPPVITRFEANPSALDRPRALNWSLGFERKLPASVYVKAEFIEKRGMDGFDYANAGGVGASGVPASGLFVLQNQRKDHYDGVTVSARHTFREQYPVMISYTRSAAHTNTDLLSTLDNPIFGAQLPGPLSWDSPNRVVGWGWVPLARGFTFGYTIDWHTGYPFSLVNEDQEPVGLPNTRRFPNYVVVNVHIEKQFRFAGYEWALRGGFNDVTSSSNPSAVNNNVDSAQFLQYSGFQHRAFTGRIRFIGRKK